MRLKDNDKIQDFSILCPTLIFKVIMFFISLGYNYGAVSNNHMHLRIELSTESKENPDQLMKVYFQHLTESTQYYSKKFTFPSYIGW